MKLKIFLFLFLAMAFETKGQKDPNAKVILDGMSQKYQSIKGFTAGFDYTFQDAGIANDRQTGEIAVSGEKYWLKLPEQEIFNDGKTVWTFIQTNTYKEVTINDASQTEGELTPSNIYKMYQSGFNYKLLADKTYQGRLVKVVELTALKSNSPFKQVKLMVDKATMDLLGWEMFDGQGGVFSYSFKNMEVAANLPADYFVFDVKKHPGVEVIDLR